MNFINKPISMLAVLFLIGMGASSCNKSFLDVSKELADEQDLNQIFTNPNEVRRFHTHLYTGIPNTLDLWWHFFNAGPGNPWPHLADETRLASTGFIAQINGISVTDTDIGHWTRLYRLIRQANVFMDRVVVIPQQGFADYLDEEEVAEKIAVARFLRAYYHFLLFELYGPIPIMDYAVSPDETNLDFARNSVDEVVDFIYKELTEVAELLKDPDLTDYQFQAVPTKGAALALRAKLMVYAASPLFNGGYEEALSLVNPEDGKRLFPDHDPNKWQRAVDAMQEFMDYADIHYELHREYTNGVYDPEKSLYQVHMKVNKETIFVNSTPYNFGYANKSWHGTKIPRGARGGSNVGQTVGVRQELVDAFFMADGLPIDESPLYSESGFSSAGEDLTGRTEPGTHRMFVNREPRFYNTVFYNGGRWQIENTQIWFNWGGNSDASATFYPRTGHLLFKRTNREASYLPGYADPATLYQPAVIFRLADFYLLYAEALNEVNPGDPRIIEYIDKIRDRAGIPLLADIKPHIIGNKEAQRKAIVAERRVELAVEGQRYFDVNRWMIAGNTPDAEAPFGGDVYGMDMFAPTLEGFYNRVFIYHKVWRKAMYLYPIPVNEIQKSRLLVQNPLY